MHLNAFSSIALYLKNHSILKCKFRKILIENTFIAHEINKLRLQIQKPKINRINFEYCDNVLKYL